LRRVAVAAIAGVLLAVVGVIALIVVATGGQATSASSQAGPYRGSEPPGINRLPSFRLRSIDGGTVDSTRLRGKVMVVTFVDSACHEFDLSAANLIHDVHEALARSGGSTSG